MNFFPKRNSFTDLELKFMVTKKKKKMSWAGRNQLVHINLKLRFIKQSTRTHGIAQGTLFKKKVQYEHWDRQINQMIEQRVQ